MTHAELCAIAVRWLRRPYSARGHGCRVAVSECRADYGGEVPDAIGFRTGWRAGSVVVECKTSRADFLADRAKPHRQAGGMGTWRYFMAPTGLLRWDELPPRWGLLEVNGRGHVSVVAGAIAAAGHWRRFPAALDAFAHQADVERERDLLTGLLARLGDAEAMNLRIREAERGRMRLQEAYLRQEAELRALRAERWHSRQPE